MKIRISTHKPNPTLWLVALLLFLYGLVALPFPMPGREFAMPLAAVLLLLGTTVI